jgi:DNA processing protein
LVITSGLAYGIDAAAHRGALSAGGPTIAVFGSGIDRIYPRRHEALAEQIWQTGALITEFPLGSPPRAHHFPRRNRVISGLTRGTVVVEAAASSGSLITAMQALDQGREVFAVPGSIRSPLSRGCHALIKQGAKLVESAADILDEIGHFAEPDTGVRPRVAIGGDSDQDLSDVGRKEAVLLHACGFEPTTIDALVSRSGLTANEVSSMLLTLELKGHIESCSGASFVRKGLA